MDRCTSPGYLNSYGLAAAGARIARCSRGRSPDFIWSSSEMITDSKKASDGQAAIVVVTFCILSVTRSAWLMAAWSILAIPLLLLYRGRVGWRATTMLLAVAALTGGAVATLVHVASTP
jgi:hypothetical protein